MNGKEILKALRIGSVPKDGISEILVGHEIPITELTGELTEIKNNESSSIRFIQGDYGSGKTMLSSYLMERALEMNFCISQIVIDPTVQLGNFSQVYNAFCQNLRTPESQDSSGLVNILEGWSFKQLRMYLNMEGLSASNSLNPVQSKNYISYLENELVSVRNLDPSLSRAIASFAGGKIQKNSELSKYALDWIRANDNIPSKDFSKQLQLKGKINSDDAYNFLKGLLFLIKETGFSGTLIVLDEVETIRHLPQKPARMKAYEILRHIIDDSASGQFVCSFFLVTATRELFDNRTGIKEYLALEERIKQITNSGNTSSCKQPILKLMPMQESDLKVLAKKIRKIHGECESWNISEKITDEGLSAIVSYLSAGSMGIKESDPRKFLRRLVEVFDALKQHPQKTIQDLMPETGE